MWTTSHREGTNFCVRSNPATERGPISASAVTTATVEETCASAAGGDSVLTQELRRNTLPVE